MGLGDFMTALQFRDLLQKLIQTEVDSKRPQPKYGTVTAIDRTLRKCSVMYPDDVVSVKVSMGSVQPSAVGQTVRIDGIPGDRFVADVMGPIYLDQPDMKGPVDVTGDVNASGNVTATGTVTGGSVTGTSITGTSVTASGAKLFLGTNDLIRHDDTTNRWHFLSDFATSSDDPGNADLQFRQGYYVSGASHSAIANAKNMVFAGGIIKTTDTSLGWTNRMQVSANGYGPTFAPSGFYSMDMPADGTVIAGYGGAANVTVAAGMIPFPSWGTLWYELPLGSASPMVPANWHMTTYNGVTGTNFEVPPHWIPVAMRRADATDARWWTALGEYDYWRPATLTNSWVNYGGGNYDDAAYRKENGVVSLHGLIKTGTIGSSAFTLPVGFRPDGRKLFTTISNNAIGRIDIDETNGQVIPSLPAVNNWVSLDHIQFVAGQ